MPLNDRLSNVDELRSWKDQLPLHYEYTAGLAGEKFLRGLKDGKILAAKCSNCGKAYLPPKVYCVDCYVAIEDFVEVGPRGRVAALATSSVGFDGRELEEKKTFAFVAFKGVEGGLVHLAGGRGLRIGAQVKPRFRAKDKRKGALSDIEEFVA